MQSDKLERAQSNLVGQFRSRTSFTSKTRPKNVTRDEDARLVVVETDGIFVFKAETRPGHYEGPAVQERGLNVHSFKRSFCRILHEEEYTPFFCYCLIQSTVEKFGISDCAAFKLWHLCSPALVGVDSSNQIYKDLSELYEMRSEPLV